MGHPNYSKLSKADCLRIGQIPLYLLSISLHATCSRIIAHASWKSLLLAVCDCLEAANDIVRGGVQASLGLDDIFLFMKLGMESEEVLHCKEHSSYRGMQTSAYRA